MFLYTGCPKKLTPLTFSNNSNKSGSILTKRYTELTLKSSLTLLQNVYSGEPAEFFSVVARTAVSALVLCVASCCCCCYRGGCVLHVADRADATVQ